IPEAVGCRNGSCEWIDPPGSRPDELTDGMAIGRASVRIGPWLVPEPVLRPVLRFSLGPAGPVARQTPLPGGVVSRIGRAAPRPNQRLKLPGPPSWFSELQRFCRRPRLLSCGVRLADRQCPQKGVAVRPAVDRLACGSRFREVSGAP